MKKIILIAFTYCSAGVVQAQSQKSITITGIVTDATSQKPVSFVTVGLYKTTDIKTPVKNVLVNDKGSYEFKIVPPGSYMLFFTHTAYEEKKIQVTADSLQPLLKIEAQYLTPLARSLSGVTVVAERKKPLVEQEEDKMIYNAEADPSNMGLTALDLLRKTPLVTLDGDDNIQLNGQTNFRILLNGRETGMFARDPKNVLKGFPAASIQKIEVITNPSAKYDGEGVGGLINIITKKKVVGYNGWVGTNNTNVNQNMYGGLNLKYNKWGVSSSGGINTGKNLPAIMYSDIIPFNPVAYSKRLANGTTESNFTGYWSNLELSYEMDSLNTFSLYFNKNKSYGNIDKTSLFDLVLPVADTLKSRFDSYNRYNNPFLNWGLDYIRKFKANKEKEISFKFFNEYSKNKNFDTSGHYSDNSNTYTINDNFSRDRQTTFQADLIQPLEKNRKLELGVKGILRKAIADYKNYYRDDQLSKYELVIPNSDYFDYKQNVYSAYFTYRRSWKKFSARLGARLEHTTVDGNFRRTATQVNQQYSNLLPNIFLSRKIKLVHTLSFSYSKRLNRPYMWNLNPFKSNTDSLNVSSGNPYLDPQISHNFEFGYNLFKGQTNINIKLSENFTNNQILRYSFFDDATGIRTSTYENIGAAAITSLSGNISTKFTPKWSLFVNLNLQYVFLKNNRNAQQKNRGFGGNVFLNTGYQVTQRWNFTAFGNLFKTPVTLQSDFAFVYFASFGGGYKFLKNKNLNVLLTANNPFSKHIPWSSTTKDVNFSTYTETNFVRRSFGFSISWNFGKLSENVSRKRGVSNDDLKAKE